MHELKNLPISHILVMGDFNMPGIDWITWSSPDKYCMDFLDSCRDSFLYQHVREPTRGRYGQNPHTLDLIFSNEENMVINVVCESPLGKSDHACVIFDFLCHGSRNIPERTVYQYHKGDYDAMKCNLLSVDWDTILSEANTCNNMYEKFVEILLSVQDEHIPNKTIRSASKKKAKGLGRADLELINRKQSLAKADGN